MDETPEILPFQRLVCAAACASLGRAVHVFALDNACAHIARTVTEPLMAQIRLAWWRDGLTADALGPMHQAPDIAALRAVPDFSSARAGMIALVDGWEALIVRDDAGAGQEILSAYAQGRGGGLFAALAPGHAEYSALAGQIWALWDLAGHVHDPELAGMAIDFARVLVEQQQANPRLPRMLAMMAGVAREDVRRGRGAARLLTPRLYGRLVRIQLFGR